MIYFIYLQLDVAYKILLLPVYCNVLVKKANSKIHFYSWTKAWIPSLRMVYFLQFVSCFRPTLCSACRIGHSFGCAIFYNAARLASLFPEGRDPKTAAICRPTLQPIKKIFVPAKAWHLVSVVGKTCADSERMMSWSKVAFLENWWWKVTEPKISFLSGPAKATPRKKRKKYTTKRTQIRVRKFFFLNFNYET